MKCAEKINSSFIIWNGENQEDVMEFLRLNFNKNYKDSTVGKKFNLMVEATNFSINVELGDYIVITARGDLVRYKQIDFNEEYVVVSDSKEQAKIKKVRCRIG